MKRKSAWIVARAVLLCCCLIGTVYAVSSGEKVKVKGLITQRSSDNFTLRTSDSGDMVVMLTDDTKVERPKGLLKLRKQKYEMVVLTPGLGVEVNGVGDDQNRVVANKIRFSKDSLITAQAIQAGLVPTQQQVETNREDIAANKENIAAIDTRFNGLTDWNTKASAAVYFPNGSADLSPQDKQHLMQLAREAANLDAYIIEVKGYASSPGTAEENQKLSMDRAQGVIQYLQESCKVPIRHIIAPAALGETRPVASNATPEGQAENRRVEVTVLVNKGLQGGPISSSAPR
jgi:OOP family OmpA-OmpF porin